MPEEITSAQVKEIAAELQKTVNIKDPMPDLPKNGQFVLNTSGMGADETNYLGTVAIHREIARKAGFEIEPVDVVAGTNPNDIGYVYKVAADSPVQDFSAIQEKLAQAADAIAKNPMEVAKITAKADILPFGQMEGIDLLDEDIPAPSVTPNVQNQDAERGR